MWFQEACHLSGRRSKANNSCSYAKHVLDCLSHRTEPKQGHFLGPKWPGKAAGREGRNEDQ